MGTRAPRFHLSPFWHPEDGEALALIIQADSGAFSGYTEVEAIASDMRAIGAELRDFPSCGVRSEVIWELRGWLSAARSQLRFHIADGLGHAAIEARLLSDIQQGECATVFVPTEVAMLNQLGQRLVAWSEGKELEREFVVPANI